MRCSVKIARIAGTEIRPHIAFLLFRFSYYHAGAIRDGQLGRIGCDRDANRFTFTPQAAPATEPEVVAAR